MEIVVFLSLRTSRVKFVPIWPKYFYMQHRTKRNLIYVLIMDSTLSFRLLLSTSCPRSNWLCRRMISLFPSCKLSCTGVVVHFSFLRFILTKWYVELEGSGSLVATCRVGSRESTTPLPWWWIKPQLLRRFNCSSLEVGVLGHKRLAASSLIRVLLLSGLIFLVPQRWACTNARLNLFFGSPRLGLL